MKTHRMWILALANVVAMTVGQAYCQTSGPVFASLSQGFSAVQQAGHASCGACNGAGCGICGAGSSRSYASGSATSSCGCSSGSCGGGGCTAGVADHLMADGLAMQHFHAMEQYGAQGFHGGGCGPGGCGAGGCGAGGCGLGNHGPFGDGGCCTPMWYDLHVEWMNLRRDGVGDNIDITSRNAGGPIVLSTDDLDLGEANGFRLTYAFLIGASTALEVSYFGAFEWDSSSAVTGDGDLYSVFSGFGQTINPGVGFPGTVDAANYHSISYESELNNVEVNMRRRWVSENCLFHGSYLGGLRYLSLREYFNHATEAASGGSLNYDLDTKNDLFGAQIGTDMYMCISPRFKLGLEIEAGIYANSADADTYVTGVDVDTPIVPVSESEGETDVAGVFEAGIIGIFKVTPRWTIRGGYQGLSLNGVALATENFNTAAPLLPRTAFIDSNGDAYYHGATLGSTFVW